MKKKKIISILSSILCSFAFVGLFAVGLVFGHKQKRIETKAESSNLLLQKDFNSIVQFNETYENVTYECELDFVGYYQYYRFYDGVQTTYNVTISFTNIQYRNLTLSSIKNFETTNNDSGSVLITKTTDRYLYLRYDIGLELISIVNTTSPPQPGEVPEYWKSRFNFTLKYGSDTDLSFNGVLRVPYFTNEPRFYNGDYNQMLFEDDLTTQIGEYEQGYNDGYSVGESQGEQLGYTNGYSDGLEVGKEEQLTIDEQLFDDYYAQGYSAGYSQGSSQDETVSSIFGGMSTVALVPIRFFLEIFNFEILGINVASVVSALLSICLIIIVWRVVMGGKSND